MKNIVFFLLLIPILGIAQTETRAMNLPLEDYLDLNHGNTTQMESNYSKASIVTKPLVSMYLNTTDGYKMLLDSFYEVDFNPTWNTYMHIQEYYKYDEKGNVILLTNYTPCPGCVKSTYKVESEFDENNHLTMKLVYLWDFNAKQWVKDGKTVYIYDLNGALITFTHNGWYEGTEVNPYKTDFSYDDHGNVVSKVGTRHDLTTSEWIGDIKEEFTYKNDKCTLQIDYEWNKDAGQWKNSSKYEDEYDDNGNQISGIIYSWNGSTNQWVGYYKNTSTYSSNGKMTNSTDFNWEITTMQWVGSTKTDYLFDTIGNEIQSLASNWDKAQNLWINSEKIDYSFDSNGNVILKIDSNWNTSLNQWIGDTKFESSYNGKELLISLITSKWNKTSKLWDPSTKYEYEYDGEGNNTIKIFYKWNLTTKDWDVWNTYNYYYSLHNLTDNLDISDSQKVKLYPNPAHEMFVLEINDRSVTQCELFNSNGQLLKTLPVEQGVNNYTIRDLKKGLYLVKIKSEKGTMVKKIIKN